MVRGDQGGGDTVQQTVIDNSMSPSDTETVYDQDSKNAFFSDSLNPAQRAFFPLKVDTDKTGSSPDDNLSGDLEITATQPADEA